MPELAHIFQELSDAMKHADEEKERMKGLWGKFSTEVRRRRLEKKMIYKQLAAKTGIGHGTLFYLEHGEREWTVDRARRVMKALK